jgi:uncharacterized iron-regulated protein
MGSIVPLLLALLLSGCAHGGRAPSLEEPEALFSTAGPLSLDDFSRYAAGARFVLVGESHGSACDHRVQAELIRALSSRRPAIGLEMVEEEQQPILERFSTGEMEVGALSEALDWNDTWGVDFELYRPIFEVAHEEDLPLAALNLPRAWVRTVGRQGLEGLSEEERSRLPPIEPAPPAQEEMLRRAFEAHMGRDHGEEAFQRFITAQSLWDSQMASRALEASEILGRPMVILAGAGHVTFGWGIASRLERAVPRSEILLVMPWRGGEAPDPQEADLWYHCPLTDRGSPPPE